MKLSISRMSRFVSGSVWVRVRVSVQVRGFVSGSVFVVSGFVSGSCLVSVWVHRGRVRFVLGFAGSYLGLCLIRSRFISVSCPFRIRFVIVSSLFCICIVFHGI